MEVQHMHNSSDAATTLFLSIGTGIKPRYRFGGPFGKYYSFVQAARRLATGEDSTQERLLTVIGSVRSDTYFRLNVDNQELGSIKRGEWKKSRWNKASTSDYIRGITEKYIGRCDIQQAFDKIAHILVDRCRCRAKSQRWGEWALAVGYRCLEVRCSEGLRVRRREELQKHLEEDHAFGPPDKQTLEIRQHFEELMARGKFQE